MSTGQMLANNNMNLANTLGLNKTRKNANINANTEGLDSCKIIKNMTNTQRGNLVKKQYNYGENVSDTHQRGAVFLYLKHKESPLLTEKNIQSAYTMPNESRFPLRLTDEQMDELCSSILTWELDYATEDKPQDQENESMAHELFHSSISELDTELRIWEHHNQVIFHGNTCKIGSSVSYFVRYIAWLKLSAEEKQDNEDIEIYQCKNPGSFTKKRNDCFYIFNTIQYYYAFPDTFGIVISDSRANINLFIIQYVDKIRVIRDGFKKGSVVFVEPKFGWMLQKMHANIWEPYWNSSKLDDVDRITLLTLQKYVVLQLHEENEDCGSCSNIYKESPLFLFQNLLNYINNKDAFLDELVKNQWWVQSSTKNQFNNYTNQPYGVRYRTIEDLEMKFLNIVKPRKNSPNPFLQPKQSGLQNLLGKAGINTPLANNIQIPNSSSFFTRTNKNRMKFPPQQVRKTRRKSYRK